ncbi:hypothetical protein D3C87_2050590 [compost metagenome]
MKVDSHPSLEYMMYWGITTTSLGSIITPITQVNKIALPLKGIRARPYATKAEEQTAPIVAKVAINSEFLKKVAKVVLAKPLQPVT